ncbi:cobyric acid synthase CobQ [Vibrio parahaemolyticus]|uniref:cobyric acid synthase n=1 Tax=Vibrio parahaemolyticus TaxID=670 RepID=UPI0006A5AC48|nr:cobyric acid synthase [Vibrio parahaemolyticus]EJG0948833.1 cobyric acid synthase [Vibrio parahaemolyticus O1:K58]EGQ8286498.1 cobyric acid synthase [Vibrio parahaemolyticus]EGQ8334493.1 cobyric acid synthase [Vibrio parahaemolyticus]EHH1094121.1 cobyric acid synthase [Vibrio parahaemolyticus]EHR1132724.1 cobyric acid synthase [Vibrio parahaemolyticus]
MKSAIPSLMVQGTTSDAGKSVLVAGLCRVLARKGINVAPFKPQNMALNSAVTKDGGEIGRAQAVQAQACNIEPTVHMNPVLIKPNSDTGAQIILQGKALSNMDAASFHDYKKVAMNTVLDSFSKLTKEFDSIMIEGAGSPAEINLREGDIANMGFAEAADVPVIIVADIDRGGVFAHLYGTLALLSESEQTRVKGFVINRFRGDIRLLQSGLDWLEEKTGKPVLGVLPYLHGLNLEAEDAITAQQELNSEVKLNVVVPVLTRISNHTDFDVLRLNPDINLRYVGKGDKIDKADLIILPGTKSVRDDLAYLKSQGWDKDILRHIRLGGKVMGICGGYQMLGKTIDDPDGVEGEPGSSEGLGLLNVHTVLTGSKQLTKTEAVLNLNNQKAKVKGYEIHVGRSQVLDEQPLKLDNGERDGAISECGQIMGTYLHGCFDEAEALNLITEWVNGTQVKQQDFEALKEQGINRIADAIEQHMNLDFLFK